MRMTYSTYSNVRTCLKVMMKGKAFILNVKYTLKFYAVK